MSVEALEQLDQALEARYGRYDFQPGGQERRQDNRATYQARITTQRGDLLQPSFELERNPQTGLWEISAIADLPPEP